MKTNKLTMRVCLKKKRISLTRTTIATLGNPSHLSFWYDENDALLIFAPAAKDELDSYEIPRFYWSDASQACEISRIKFLKALQYRIGWENGCKYLYEGTLAESAGIPAVVFHLDKGVKVSESTQTSLS